MPKLREHIERSLCGQRRSVSVDKKIYKSDRSGRGCTTGRCRCVSFESEGEPTTIERSHIPPIPGCCYDTLYSRVFFYALTESLEKRTILLIRYVIHTRCCVKIRLKLLAIKVSVLHFNKFLH